MKRNFVFFSNTLWFLEKFKYELIKDISRENNVTCIYLRPGPSINKNKTILCVSENGYGKKSKLEDFSLRNRGGQGVIALKTSERNGLMVSAVSVNDDDGVMLISDKGTMIRTVIDQIPTLGRNTQGVKVISPKQDEKVIECVRIPFEE